MNLIRKTILLLGAAVVLPAMAHAQMSEGTVRVFSVRGNVNLVDVASGKTQPLQRGMEFSDGTAGMQVVTGEKSSALLLFSNGSAVTVSESSRFTVREFIQAEFDPAQGTFLRLTEDPSTSKTELYLDQGTVAGQVKRLQEGSEYTVNTPTASAGIRGTDYVVTVIVSDGEIFTTITNTDGQVVAIIPGQTDINIPVGQSVTVRGTRTVAPNGQVTYTITQVGEPEPASAEALAASQEAVENAQNAGDGNTTGPETVGPNDGTTPDVDINPDLVEETSPAGG